ncbi:LOW QUALITY PROTEIN: serine-threonine kinase [Cinnamomum micranthum f. kanehirae]|uniref:Serine-threonine kinase n=1 Tax=Cinnamomum micranthum f. kanehirae TaxID=337451 RepID=A0A443PN23_9MAGN|nr:LOW QUALITY PROTEIN: serine-threonine kinase [Cinnamomum micranthum f. kanehirae]
MLFSFMKSWLPKPRYIIVLEYAVSSLTRVAKGKLKDDVARKYFQQLVSAVDFCHAGVFNHRDLKPENLLVDENENLKRQDGFTSHNLWDSRYVAPEVISRKGYGRCKKLTFGSCGVILFVSFGWISSIHDSNLMELYRKVGKAEYKCPNWFPPEAASKDFGSEPEHWISIAKIKDNSCSKGDLKAKLAKGETKFKELASLDTDAASASSGTGVAACKPEHRCRKEARFTSKQPASTIISKLEDIAKRLRLKVKKKDEGILKLEGSKEGRKGVLSIDAEIFEVNPSFHLVEVRKSSGIHWNIRSYGYQDMRPALTDIVWAWQGDQQQQESLERRTEQRFRLALGYCSEAGMKLERRLGEVFGFLKQRIGRRKSLGLRSHLLRRRPRLAAVATGGEEEDRDLVSDLCRCSMQ